MRLGDFLPQKARQVLQTPKKIKVGSVIRAFVNDTNPPKIKLFVVVGCNNDKTFLATVFINSDLNTNVHFSTELQALQVLLTAEKCDFLDHDSYIDCSDIVQRDAQDLAAAIQKKPEIYRDELDPEDLQLIIETLKKSPKIKGKFKKKFGFFDH